jgi:hypothetical protein
MTIRIDGMNGEQDQQLKYISPLSSVSSLCFDNDKLLPHSTPEERIHTSFHPAGDTEPIWLTHPDAFSLVYIDRLGG